MDIKNDTKWDFKQQAGIFVVGNELRRTKLDYDITAEGRIPHNPAYTEIAKLQRRFTAALNEQRRGEKFEYAAVPKIITRDLPISADGDEIEVVKQYFFALAYNGQVLAGADGPVVEVAFAYEVNGLQALAETVITQARQYYARMFEAEKES